MRRIVRRIAAFLAVLVLAPVLAPSGAGGGFSSVHAAGCPSEEEQRGWYPKKLAGEDGIEVGLQECGGWNSFWAEKYYDTKTNENGQIDKITTYHQASYRSTQAGMYYYRTVKYYFVFAGENIYYTYHSDPELGDIKPGRDVVLAITGDNQSIGADVRDLHGNASDTWDRLTREHPNIYPDGGPKIEYVRYARDFILNNQPSGGYAIQTAPRVWSSIPTDQLDQLLDRDAPYLVIAPAIMVYRTTKASKTDGIDIIGYIRPDKFEMRFKGDGTPDNQAIAQSALDYIFGPGMPGVFPVGDHTKEEVQRVFNMTARQDYHTLFQVIPLHNNNNPPDYAVQLPPSERTARPGDEVNFNLIVNWKDHPAGQGFRVILAYQTPQGKLPVDFALGGKTATKGSGVSYISFMSNQPEGSLSGTVRVKAYDKPATLIAQVIPLDRNGNPLPIQPPHDGDPKNNEEKAVVKPMGVDYAAVPFKDPVKLYIPYGVNNPSFRIIPHFERLDGIPVDVPYTITIRGPFGTVTKQGDNIPNHQSIGVPYPIVNPAPGTYQVTAEIWPVQKDLDVYPANNRTVITVIVEKAPPPEKGPVQRGIHVELGS